MLLSCPIFCLCSCSPSELDSDVATFAAGGLLLKNKTKKKFGGLTVKWQKETKCRFSYFLSLVDRVLTQNSLWLQIERGSTNVASSEPQSLGQKSSIQILIIICGNQKCKAWSYFQFCKCKRLSCEFATSEEKKKKKISIPKFCLN